MAVQLVAKRTLLDQRQMARALRRMAGQIVEKNRGTEGVILVGIRTRGVPLAERLAAEIEAMEGTTVAMGILDITLYRDDLSTIGPHPVVKESRLPGKIDGMAVVLCDDVLYTGRTVRAALDALLDYGRPRSVQLAVLVDRGHRELPIHADYVGERVVTSEEEVVKVSFASTDDAERVEMMRRHEGAS